MTEKKLVYGLAGMHESLAFIEADEAAAAMDDITAVWGCPTWGEARRAKTTLLWNPVPDLEDDPDGPPDDAAFDIRDVGAVADGDWPPMITSASFEVLPEDLQKRFGKLADTTFNGDYLSIPPEAEAELVAELRARGYEVARDDNLINDLNMWP